MLFHKEQRPPAALYRPPPLKPRAPARASVSLANRSAASRYDNKENGPAAPPSANHKQLFLNSGCISLDTLRSLCQEDEGTEVLEKKLHEFNKPPSMKRQVGYSLTY